MANSSTSNSANWVLSELFAMQISDFKEDGLKLAYRLIGTELKWEQLELQVRIRPADDFKAFSETISASSRKLTEARMKQMMSKAQKFKDGVDLGKDEREFFLEVQMPLQKEQRAICDAFVEKLRVIFGLEELVILPISGWMVYVAETGEFRPLNDDNDYKTTEISAKDPGFTEISGLQSNTKYEITVCGREKGTTKWGEPTPLVSFWTQPADWEIILQRNGLGSLIPLFYSQGYNSVESWAQLGDDKKMEELGLDASTVVLLKEVMNKAGIITKEEKLRIENEQETLAAYVAKMAQTVSSTSGFPVGTPILNKDKRFGVVTQTTERGVLVRYGNGLNAKVEESKIKDLKPSSFDVFISHAQGEAQNQVGHLGALLQEYGISTWVDMDAVKLEAEDMCRGIANSKSFVVYLTQSYFDRYFCRMEAMMAKTLGKPLIIVFESDVRHGGDADYVKLVNAATRKYPAFKEWALSVEAIPMARRAYQRRALIEELVSRLGSDVKINENAGKRKTEARVPEKKTIQLLQNKVADLQSEVEDLFAENKALWAAIEELRKKN